jgi:hypothetical protein
MGWLSPQHGANARSQGNLDKREFPESLKSERPPGFIFMVADACEFDVAARAMLRHVVPLFVEADLAWGPFFCAELPKPACLRMGMRACAGSSKAPVFHLHQSSTCAVRLGVKLTSVPGL